MVKEALIMLLETPYFMTNEEWYYYSTDDYKYHLTEKAPAEAVESYNKFYQITRDDEGNEIIWG